MFKVALLCAAAGFSSAAISAVTGQFENNKHTGNSRGGLWLCATHGTAVTSSGTNTITYEYPADEIKFTAMGDVRGTDFDWHTGATNIAGATGAAASTTAVCAHTVASTTGTIVCNTVAVTSTQLSCLLMKKAYPVKNIITKANIKVKQSETDSTFVASTVDLKVFTNPFTAVTLTTPTADATLPGTEGTIKISFTPNADITTSNKVTVGAPGYTFGVGAQCGFGTGTKSTATTAESVGFIAFTPGAASGTAATYVECTKFTATSVDSAPVFSVWVGTSDATTSIQGEFVTGKAVKTKAPTAFSAASQVSYNAVFIGATVAASLFLI
jgi:hypothetical protein